MLAEPKSKQKKGGKGTINFIAVNHHKSYLLVMSIFYDGEVNVLVLANCTPGQIRVVHNALQSVR